MLVGTVAEVGPEPPLGPRGRRPGRHAGVPLADPAAPSPTASRAGTGAASRCPREGTRSSSAAPSPPGCPTTSHRLALMVMDVCGAPALVARVVREYVGGDRTAVAVLGGAGKSGSLSLAAARDAGAGRSSASCPFEREAGPLRGRGLADEVVLADARAPLGLSRGRARGGRPRRRHRRLRRRPRLRAAGRPRHGGPRHHRLLLDGHVSFAAAALGSRGAGRRRHDDDRQRLRRRGMRTYALDVLRRTPAVRSLFEARLRASPGRGRAGPPAGTHGTRARLRVMRTLYRGGAVYSPADPFATALSRRRHRRLDRLRRGAGHAADAVDDVIELDGALVTPAFTDAHVHVTETGLALGGSTSGRPLRRRDPRRRTRGRAAARGRPVLGPRLGRRQLAEGRPPTRRRAGPRVVRRGRSTSAGSTHSAVVSSALAESAGARDTPVDQTTARWTGRPLRRACARRGRRPPSGAGGNPAGGRCAPPPGRAWGASARRRAAHRP